MTKKLYCWCFKDNFDDGPNEVPHGPFNSLKMLKRSLLDTFNEGHYEIEIREMFAPQAKDYMQNKDLELFLATTTQVMFDECVIYLTYDNALFYIPKPKQAKAQKELDNFISTWATKYVKSDGLRAGEKILEIVKIADGKIVE
jgi:hypothetical protein